MVNIFVPPENGPGSAFVSHPRSDVPEGCAGVREGPGVDSWRKSKNFTHGNENLLGGLNPQLGITG